MGYFRNIMAGVCSCRAVASCLYIRQRMGYVSNVCVTLACPNRCEWLSSDRERVDSNEQTGAS